ncbi:hypothetical protein QWA_03045 [Alcaligenes faecalis subsp. faecalis NCIB 8687]|nr:hypothetical protein QWA_03045 [Alcaligenes faecalis subsp. faecalis NCIB 8687]
MKYSSIHKKVSGVLSSLPDVYSIQPTTNYQEIVSHFADNLMLKAWARTADQLNLAVRSFEQREPEIAERIRQFHELSEDQQRISSRFASLARRAEELQRASGILEDQFRAAIERSERDARRAESVPGRDDRANRELAEI